MRMSPTQQKWQIEHHDSLLRELYKVVIIVMNVFNQKNNEKALNFTQCQHIDTTQLDSPVVICMSVPAPGFK